MVTENDSDFITSYVNVHDMRLDLNKRVVTADIWLTVILFILLILELTEVIDRSDTNLTKMYLKLPFLYCLCLHHVELKQLCDHKYPRFDTKHFKSYKEKVVFVLKKIVNEYGQYSNLT